MPKHTRRQVELPAGTVTLMMTDIEGSTRLLQRLGRDYARLLSDHDDLLRAAAAGHGGHEVDTQGDAFFFAFGTARDAVGSAVAIQRGLAARQWRWGNEVRVRIGVHTGEPDVAEDRGYLGLDVHRVARLCSAAHGGQVVLSQSTADLVTDVLPDGVSLSDLGVVRLKDIDRPDRVMQLMISGLQDRFPRLRTADDTPFHGAELALAAQLYGATAAARPSGARPGPLQVLLLGPVDVRRDGDSIGMSAPKHRMILAALALRLGDVVSIDSLIDTLWAERPPATAQKAVQVYVSELRKLLAAHGSVSPIVSHPPGYRLAIGPDQVDVHRFERRWEAGRSALDANQAEKARTLLGEALAEWRGDPLSDLRYEDAFAAEIDRLEEMRIGCLEDRIDADLSCGRHTRLMGELEALVRRYPLRERLRAQLILALYRSGRQAEALAAFRHARATLMGQLGIDPSPRLARLERQILHHDPALAAPTGPPSVVSGPALSNATPRTVLVVSQSSADLQPLVDLGSTIAASPLRELVLTRVITAAPGRNVDERLAQITRRLARQRDELTRSGILARVAAFSSPRPADDVRKLALHQDAELLIADGTEAVLGERAGITDQLLDVAACDVALHVSREAPASGDGVMVPFSGGEHDWAALELAAELARVTGMRLTLVGAQAVGNDANASRLLATASLVLQRLTGILAEPLLVPAGGSELLAAASNVSHLVMGLSPRFREEGLGDLRYRIGRYAPAPVTFVRRGTRPGVLAPPDGLTRFTWSITTRD